MKKTTAASICFCILSLVPKIGTSQIPNSSPPYRLPLPPLQLVPKPSPPPQTAPTLSPLALLPYLLFQESCGQTNAESKLRALFPHYKAMLRYRLANYQQRLARREALPDDPAFTEENKVLFNLQELGEEGIGNWLLCLHNGEVCDWASEQLRPSFPFKKRLNNLITALEDPFLDPYLQRQFWNSESAEGLLRAWPSVFSPPDPLRLGYIPSPDKSTTENLLAWLRQQSEALPTASSVNDPYAVFNAAPTDNSPTDGKPGGQDNDPLAPDEPPLKLTAVLAALEHYFNAGQASSLNIISPPQAEDITVRSDRLGLTLHELIRIAHAGTPLPRIGVRLTVMVRERQISFQAAPVRSPLPATTLRQEQRVLNIQPPFVKKMGGVVVVTRPKGSLGNYYTLTLPLVDNQCGAAIPPDKQQPS